MSDRDYDFGLEPGETFEPEELDDEIELDQPHVMTALGPVDPGSLGVTLPHEHVIVKPRDVALVDPDMILDSVDAAFAELEDVYYAGARTVVDMTSADMGRDPVALRWVAQRAPVHLVLATGHHQHRYAAPWVSDRSAAEIAAVEIDEIRNGIEGRFMRAGVIAAGTSRDQITGVERRLLQAAAIAHQETGTPISTHTDQGTMALEQLSILREAGVTPERVIVGHLDFAFDEGYLRHVLDTGAFVAFDRVSNQEYVSDADRAAMLRSLAEAGYLDQLLVSGDLRRKTQWLAYGGKPGLRYLVESFPVILMEAGFSAPEVRQLLVDNPQRALTTLA